MKPRKFDKEYSTQFMAEVIYLGDHGVRYTFVKDSEGISTFKYTKTAKLFHVLQKFYRNLETNSVTNAEIIKPKERNLLL